mgnify:CR=1 FL=1
MLDKVIAIKQRYQDLTEQFMQVGDDYMRAAEINKERIDLEEVAGKASEYHQTYLRLEEARQLRDQIEALRAVSQKQSVDINEAANHDVIGLARESNDAVAVVMQFREGALLGRQEFTLDIDTTDTDEVVVQTFLTQYYNHQPNLPDGLVLPFGFEEIDLFEVN